MKYIKIASVKDDDEAAQLDLLLADEKDDVGASKKHFNLKDLIKEQAETGKKKKRNLKRSREAEEPMEKKTVDDFQIDPDDARFSAVYNSHLFNIDRSDPNYKPTLGMERLVAEKTKRKMTDIDKDKVAPKAEDKVPSALSNGADALQLAKSLKKKTAQWTNRKQSRTDASSAKKSKS